jgi:AcrR family transcriptional regulator
MPETSESAVAPCPALDPRIRRTRDLLQQALVNLLETKEFDKISVQDITDQAGVNRATFYAHYPDKFALLECVVAGRFHDLLAKRGVVFDGTCNQAIRGIILGVCDYLTQTLGDCSARQLEPHLESSVVAVVRRMLLEGFQQHAVPETSGGTVSPELLASTVGWAIYGAAKEWVHTPHRIASEQIAETVFGLIAPLLNGSVPAPGSPQHP